LRLVVRANALAVQSLGAREHVLVDEAANDLAVLALAVPVSLLIAAMAYRIVRR
jgi:hypothetical protein